MWWEIYISIYPVRALTWPTSCTKGWANIMEKIINSGGLNTETMYTWEFFAYILFGIKKTPTRKILIRKISINQTPPDEFPLKKSNPQNSYLEYSHPCF